MKMLASCCRGDTMRQSKSLYSGNSPILPSSEPQTLHLRSKFLFMLLAKHLQSFRGCHTTINVALLREALK